MTAFCDDDTGPPIVMESRIRVDAPHRIGVDSETGDLIFYERQRDGMVHQTILEFSDPELMAVFAQDLVQATVAKVDAGHRKEAERRSRALHPAGEPA